MSDLLLVLIVLFIFFGNDFFGYWVFGEVMCLIWLCIDVLYCIVFIWGLVIIVVDCYMVIVYLVWYFERWLLFRVFIYIIMVWFFFIIVFIVFFIGWREMILNFYKFNVEMKRFECVLFEMEGYVVYLVMGFFVIFVVLMLFLYFRIFIIFCK